MRHAAPALPRRHRLMARPGAVMSEMVLVVPFLLLLLGYIHYFGRGVVRVQRDHAMARYEAWRQVGWGVGANSPPSDFLGPKPGESEIMNKTWFANHAESLGFDSHGTSVIDPTEVSDFVDANDADVAAKTRALIEDCMGQFPAFRRVVASAKHAETIPIWRPFEGTIRHAEVRINGDWRHAPGWTDGGPYARYEDGSPTWLYPVNPETLISVQTGNWNHNGPWLMGSVRDIHLTAIDGYLEARQDSGNRVAGEMRNIYLERPHYRGPTVH